MIKFICCVAFYAPEIEDRGHFVFVLSVILSSSLKFNLADNFWKVSSGALIFHMSIPCDKTYPWVPLFFLLVTLTLENDPFLKTFNLANNFWTVNARSLIFHISIPCDETIIFYPVTLALEFDPFFETNLWTVSARALIFHISIPFEKTFPWVTFLTLWPWPWSLTHFYTPRKQSFGSI